MKILLLVLCINLIRALQLRDITHYDTKIGETKEWWQTSAFYQIYPRSFKDSDGDGIGDLKGITEKLPYLKELGINATWLSPIYKSPMADFGYDITSFFEIQPEYGTMDDFRALVQRANELDIKIIMDFVPNHSSDENEWFIRSENSDPLYKDFYVWHPGYTDPTNSSNRLPPSNWLSAFFYSAWQWSDKRKEFYLHQFHRKQPDLNYRNPFVVETMNQVLRFWLDQGVAGFRIDAVPTCFEIKPQANGKYPDEPPSGYSDDVNNPASLAHIYTQDQPETEQLVYQWRQVLDDYQMEHGGERRILMTESYSYIDIIMRYYGDGNGKDGSNIPFNFYFITNMTTQSKADDVKKLIDYWMSRLPEGRTPNWVVGNHDQRRVGSRMGEEHIDAIMMIELTLPGVSVTYNGEEIGMTDVQISWADTKDPAACNTNAQIYEQFTRDPERTPFQWDDTTNAGFSTAAKTWLPVSPKYKEVNVAVQRAASRSYLKIFQSLIRIRQTETLKNGDLDILTYNNSVVIIQRRLQSAESYFTLANWESTHQTFNLRNVFHFTSIPDTLTIEINSLNSTTNVGQIVNTDRIELAAHECLVLRSVGINEITEPDSGVTTFKPYILFIIGLVTVLLLQ